MSPPIVTYPKPYSIAAVTLARALIGESIEENRADNANRHRLSARVRYLETVHGWLFEREHAIGQAGHSTLITRYWLDKAVIDWAGTEGQEYAMKVLRLEAKKVEEGEAATSPSSETQSEKPNNLKHENNIGVNGTQAVLGGSHHG